MIWIDQDCNIQTRMFRKQTATNMLLAWGSYHPIPLKQRIPIGQYSRARRNCSQESDFISESKKLYRRFQEQGNPQKPLKKAYQRALNTTRQELLAPISQQNNEEKKEGKNLVRCIGTYDASACDVRK